MFFGVDRFCQYLDCTALVADERIRIRRIGRMKSEQLRKNLFLSSNVRVRDILETFAPESLCLKFRAERTKPTFCRVDTSSSSSSPP